MGDQGKRLLQAVMLMLAVLLAWNLFFSKSDTPKPPPTPVETAKKSEPVEKVDVVRCKSEDLTKFEFANYVATFSSCDATLVGWHLTDPRYDKDPSKGELVRKGETRIPDDPGDFRINYRTTDDGHLPLIPPAQTWKLDSKTDTSITYSLDLGDKHFTKTFRLDPNAYMVWMTWKGTLPEEREVIPVVTVYGYQDPKTDTSSSKRVQPRVWQSTTYANGDKTQTADLDIGGDEGQQPRTATKVQWTGFEHPYLMTVFAPQKESADEDISKYTWADSTGLMRTQIELKHTKPGSTPMPARTIVGFLGPKNFELLDNADSVAGFETGFKETVDFGHLPLIGLSLSLLGKPLMWLLTKLYGFVGNWGLAIILLTIIVKGLTLFWTTRSMRSMKAMAAMSPQVQEIQKKYGDDKQRAQAETMALYKTHGIRPLAGCAPMFLQIPIWSALYIMLQSTGELFQEPFIRAWIPDLTNTDPYYILPVALLVTMFIQARLTPQNAAQPGQKMMQYGMPLMFGFMSLWFPSGLTLYIFTNTILSSLHSIYMNKFDKKSRELAELLKKNKEMVAKREKDAEEAEAAAKAGNGASKKKNGAKKPVIDVEAVEAPPPSDDDDNNDDEADAPVAAATANTGQAKARRRRKKRRN